MTDLQGAIGRVQLGRAGEILDGRRRAAHRYRELLADVDWLVLPEEPEGDRHGWQAFVTLFRPEAPSLANVDRLHGWRNALMNRLEADGIATRQGTHAPVLTSFYASRGVRAEAFPNAVLADRLTLALPLFPQMTDGELERVASALRAALEPARAEAGRG
jgi:dTDP-4-amino-4,6-dideoxygalactose transaminase